MSQVRVNFRVIAVDGLIYVIGGTTAHNLMGMGINERYTPETDAWVTLKAMPTLRVNFAIVTYNGKIYCIGGESFDEQMGMLFVG
ncbi:MAG: hypothetical protein FWF66_00810 [Candidatus Bathyarchaeota archaeon]|nr:hypothetical protein [Candidatus Termiticorpusculum sp.]